ncbi:hypothetical protein [Agarilytica rhodophyticola]|uniref:hypothetical protein n=1 Tax=Agarilytica rhodophyticola TaxID=1737490 RepID=UPI000B3431A2|nr:hypothetical protein [Agarilytica rhodophyticola]
MNPVKPLFLFSSVLLILFSLGCDGGLKGLSNQELAGKQDECIQRNPTSPGKVTACENIKKECNRRRKEGNFAC